MKRAFWFFLFAIVVVVLITLLYPRIDTNNGCPAEGNPKREELRELNKLKNRSTIPTASDFDNNVTLEKMLAPGDDRNRWNSSSAVSITGYVIKVKSGGPETCNCEAEDDSHHDTHIELAVPANANGPGGKVIVEVTPTMRDLMQKRGIDWSTDALRRSILHRQVKVQGWLMFDAEHANQSDNTAQGGKTWRTTAWEIHPVTALEVVGDPEPEVGSPRSEDRNTEPGEANQNREYHKRKSRAHRQK